MIITINGIELETKSGMTILAVAKENGIEIPTLCYLKDVNEIASCRVCVVEIKGRNGMFPACSTLVEEGMEIVTNSVTVFEARKNALELICANHVMDCTNCSRGMNCELRELCQEYAVDDRRFGIGMREKIWDRSTAYLVRDNTKCILCRRCISVCSKVQAVGAIDVNNRGQETNIGFGIPLNETNCVACGQCVLACPTGALREKDDTKQVWKAIYNKNKRVIAAVSPDVCTRIGELFGEHSEIDCSGKIVNILRKMGFDAVYNTESIRQIYQSEKLSAIKTMLNTGIKPVIDGDCPSIRTFVKNFHPEYENNLLTLKGENDYFAEYIRSKFLDEDICLVNISNCLASKTVVAHGQTFIDVAITARELFSLIHQSCVSKFTALEVWKFLEAESFDSILNDARQDSSLEQNLECKSVTAEGLANVSSVLRSAEDYDYIKVAACPGGCKNGGGALNRKHYKY